MSSCEGEGPGGLAPGLEKDFIPSWELLVFVVRKKVGRDTGHQHSELHDIPSWGSRVVGTGGIPQPQQSEGLRNQAPGITPEKKLWARAPERRKKIERTGQKAGLSEPPPTRSRSLGAKDGKRHRSWLEAKNSMMRQRVEEGL